MVLLPALLASGAALAVGAVVLLQAGGRPVGLPDGLPDAGALTGWSLRLTALLADLAAALTVGCLLVAVLLRPTADRSAPDLPALRQRALGLGARWALVWAALSVALLVLETADSAGVRLDGVTREHLARTLSTRLGAGLVMTVVVLVGVAVVAATRSSVRTGPGLLLAAVIVLVPTAIAGHADAATDPDVTGTSLVVHVWAASLWVGGLTGILVVLRRSRGALSLVLPRFSVLALVAFAAVAGSGLLTALSVLGTSTATWTSPYAAVLLVKAVLLVALGTLGHRHRRHTLRQVDAGRVDVFLRVATSELVLMGAAFGAAAGLAWTPVPTPDTTTGGGHAPAGAAGGLAPFSLAELVTGWRVNAVLLLVLALVLATYLAGVRRLARQGVRWPLARTVPFTLGVLLAVVALGSGLARYAPVLLSAQVTQLLIALLAVPALLATGAPLTLWLTSRSPHGEGPSVLAPELPELPWARRLADPVTGAALVVGLLLAVYRTPLIEVAGRLFWVQALVLLLALCCGLLLWWPLLGVDPLPSGRPGGGGAAGLAVVVASLLALAIQLRLGDQLVAGSWFIANGPALVDPLVDQRLAGAIVALAAAGLLLEVFVRLALTPRRQRGRQRVSGHTRATTPPRRSRAGTAP